MTPRGSNYYRRIVALLTAPGLGSGCLPIAGIPERNPTRSRKKRRSSAYSRCAAATARKRNGRVQQHPTASDLPPVVAGVRLMQVYTKRLAGSRTAEKRMKIV